MISIGDPTPSIGTEAGGMGAVLRAVDPVPNRPVALRKKFGSAQGRAGTDRITWFVLSS